MAFRRKLRRIRTAEEKKQPLAKLIQKIKLAVQLAEELFADSTGAEKKAWVIATLNKKIDIPVIPEPMEALLLGILIDLVVDLLNKHSFLAEDDLDVMSA